MSDMINQEKGLIDFKYLPIDYLLSATDDVLVEAAIQMKWMLVENDQRGLQGLIIANKV